MEFNCDFNAPMYVDFENMDGETGNADEFFGKFGNFEFSVEKNLKICQFLDTHIEDEPLTRDQNDQNGEEEPPKLPPRASRSQEPSSNLPLKRKNLFI